MNKKFLNILFICLISLFLISAVNAANSSKVNETIGSDNTFYQISSDLSNDDVQKMFDNSNDGDTFEFNDKEYKNISLVVDKKLNIVSNKNSVIYSANQITEKAKDLGISNSFGFYFTSKSCGSVLSGITIVASNSDYGIVVDSSDNSTIKNDNIVGGGNGILVKNADGIKILNNNISKAQNNGIRIVDSKNSIISKNVLSYNKRSGIETSDIYYSHITNNTIHHNKFNGISMFNKSVGNVIKYNKAYENPNGIYIDSQSRNDVVNANSFTSNRRNTNYELGAFESGNGLLFGADFKTSKEGDPSRLEVKYNVLAHNEGYQAKNNPDLPTFKLGDNWFDSTDDVNTFVCPMLLAGIMKMGTVSFKNGIGLQMYDTKGKPVKEFGTFDTKVNVNGNQYTAKFVNGKATIDANLDPDTEYDLEVMIGGQPVKYKYKTASGEKEDNQDSKTSDTTDGMRGASGSSSKTSTGDVVEGVSKGNSQNGNSTSAHYSSNKNSGVFGMNASGTYQDSSDNGQNAQTNGDVNSGDASNGEVSEEGKAYEIVPPSKISNEVTDTSGLVVLSIISIMGMLVYGYWRRDEFE
ncbi:nitrous oxide reductase family maturation protein NosD [uncultured Methanobrevibacter sp.]|uniref:right-handed parallel beta-helix repeat-containing protein n=1 Tax=uncultured Methanobrevibacter sp. TaxID=253161 RepID=UPI0025E52685|nr:right-handed parallel beta-helix repeat-containing protein [uncultured Methanobrevibacter sp.]